MTRRSRTSRDAENRLDELETETGTEPAEYERAELTEEGRLVLELLFGDEKDSLDYYSKEEWDRIQTDWEEYEERWIGHTVANPPPPE